MFSGTTYLATTAYEVGPPMNPHFIDEATETHKDKAIVQGLSTSEPESSKGGGKHRFGWGK